MVTNESGNAAVTYIPDGIPRIFMTDIGLMQWWLENMALGLGVIFLVSHRRQSGYGLLVTIAPKFIVDWILSK